MEEFRVRGYDMPDDEMVMGDDLNFHTKEGWNIWQVVETHNTTRCMLVAIYWKIAASQEE